MRRTAGRLHWMLIAGALGAVVVILILLSTGSTPTAAGSKFMAALARADAKEVAALSFMEGEEPAAIVEKWSYTLDVAQHYTFRYLILSELNPSPGRATLKMQVWRNYGPASYEEPFDLPMRQIDGQWKVDVRGISREMFPALPR